MMRAALLYSLVHSCALASSIRARILVCHGALDPHVPGAPELRAGGAVASAQKYFVYRGSAPGIEQFVATVLSGTTYSETHLTPNTQYYWVVSDQAHGLLSSNSNEVTATTQPAPSPPTGVTATAVNSTSISVSWTAVPNATKYYVYQQVNGGAFAFAQTVLAPTTTASIRNLTTMTTYGYQIVVETGNGDSAPSSPVATATTP